MVWDRGSYLHYKLETKKLEERWNKLNEFIEKLSNESDTISEDLYYIKEKMQELESYNIFDEIAKDYYENNLTQKEVIKKYNISRNSLNLMREKYKEKYGKKNKNNHSVLQYDKHGNLIAEYKSIKEACIQTFTMYQNIYRCLSGKIKTASGFIWKYKE